MPTTFVEEPNGDSENQNRSILGASSLVQSNNQFKVFPNPVAQNSDLNFDFTALKTEVSHIEIVGAGMNRVAYLTADQITIRMNYNFSGVLSAGIYFISVHLENGEILREKIVLFGGK